MNAIFFTIDQNGGEYHGYCSVKNASTCEPLSERKFIIDSKYIIEFDERTEFSVKPLAE